MADTTDIGLATSSPWGARLRTVLIWTVIGVVLIGIFAVLTFPYDALHTRLASELTRQTGALLQIDVRRPVRPLGIEWIGVRLSQGERPALTIGRVKGVLSWLDALQGKPVVLVSLWMDERATDPPLSARLAFADWGFQRLAAADGGAERIDVSKLVGFPVRGGRAKASFHFESSRSGDFGILDGDVQIDITDLAVEQISNQGVRVPEWSFSAVRASVQCAQQVCRIGEFSGNGSDASLTATGQILLGRSIEDSRWDVGATLVCTPAFSQRAAAVGGFPLPPGTPLRMKLVGPLLRPQLGL